MSTDSDPITYIAPVSWGLGDLIVSLPAVQAVIDSGKVTALVLRGEQQQGLAARVDGLAFAVQEKEMPSILENSNATYINLRDHPIQTRYWWGSPEFEKDYPSFRINDILRVICRDGGIDADFERLVPLKWNRRPDVQGKVLFVPGSDGTYKCWPRDHWLQLQRKLVGEGRQCVMIGQPENSEIVAKLIDANVSWIETGTLAEAVDVVSSVALAIGVDTGLMHLAVQQSTPAICLYRNNPIYFRSYEHSLHLVAPPCHPDCVARSLDCSYETVTDFTKWVPKSWDCALPESQRCLSAILPEVVFETALKFLKETKVVS